MTDERALTAWEHWRKASERLDYFVLGMSAVLTAYLGQHLVRPSVGLNGPTLELVSLGLFAFATAAGLDRVRASIAGLSAQSLELEEGERAGTLRATMLTGSRRGAIDALSGRTFTPAEADEAITRGQARAQGAHDQFAKWKQKGEFAYKLRDVLLVIGLGTYLIAKLLPAS